VNYRPYSPQDFAALYAIEELCFQPPFRFGRGYMRRLVARTNTATWIAEEEGRIAGFAIAEWVRRADGVPGDGSLSLGCKDGVIAYIQTIEVAPEHRRRGIGSELLMRIEGSARNADAASIWLHVDAGNHSAVRLYEANGYLLQGQKENYYPEGRAALVYGKTLESNR
jgi:ribosomal-protein-alanine N-acetyltransferase